MINSFDTDVAMAVGIPAAIIYKNIQFWCEKNLTNGQNIHDGYAWTYNSISAFCQQFPYLSKKQVEKALKDLEEAGYIISGHFNKQSYDRTKWYADVKKEKCISPGGEMDLPVRGNGFTLEGKPIPDINTNIKPNNKKVSKEPAGFDAVIDSFDFIDDDPLLRGAIVDFIKMRKLIKKPLTDAALKMNIKKAHQLANGDPAVTRQIFEQSVMNSWQGIFPLKDDRANSAVKGSSHSGNEFEELLKAEGYV